MAKECLSKNLLTVWGTGERKMQFIYLKDVIKYTIHALTIEEGIYNLGDEEYLSVSEVANMIARFFNAKVSFLKNKKEGEILSFMDVTKLRKTTKHNHFTPFSIALNEFLDDYFSTTKKEQIY